MECVPLLRINETMDDNGFITPPTPLLLLRLATLLTTTASLMFSIDEYFFLSILLHPSLLPQSNAILQKYFTLFFNRGIFIILSLYVLTIGTAIANLRTDLQTYGLDWWYGASLVFTFRHFVFVVWIVPPVKRIKEDRWKGQFSKDLLVWLKVHALRSLTTDLPGWICFLVAILKAVHL